MTCRHSFPVRIAQWMNALCLVIPFMSGLGIFNGWLALYWGIRTNFNQPLLAMYATQGADGPPQGVTDILGHSFDTTGWHGLSRGTSGAPVVRGFPSWATLPGPLDLATSRRWRFFFAWIFVINGAAYALYALVGGHLWRDLLPSRQQLGGRLPFLTDPRGSAFPAPAAARVGAA